jgi:hypothetical protein
MTCACARCEANRLHQERLAAGVRKIDELREERASGRRTFGSVYAILRWSYRYRASKRAAKGLPVDPRSEGTGAPCRALDDPRMRTQAAVLYAEKLACADAGKLPLALWLVMAHAGQKPYWFLAEQTGHSVDQVKRAMSRAHRHIAKRLAEGGWIERGDVAEG